jgi:hypothetical protein
MPVIANGWFQMLSAEAGVSLLHGSIENLTTVTQCDHRS